MNFQRRKYKVTVIGSAFMQEGVVRLRLDDKKTLESKMFLFKEDLLQLIMGKRHRIRLFRDYAVL